MNQVLVERITYNPAVMVGKPVIRGTRNSRRSARPLGGAGHSLRCNLG